MLGWDLMLVFTSRENRAEGIIFVAIRRVSEAFSFSKACLEGNGGWVDCPLQAHRIGVKSLPQTQRSGPKNFNKKKRERKKETFTFE
jgi:hypothetical protein